MSDSNLVLLADAITAVLIALVLLLLFSGCSSMAGARIDVEVGDEQGHHIALGYTLPKHYAK